MSSIYDKLKYNGYVEMLNLHSKTSLIFNKDNKVDYYFQD